MPVAHAPAMSVATPAPVIESMAPEAVMACAAPAPVNESVAPAPALTYATLAPVVEHVAPASECHFAPAPMKVVVSLSVCFATFPAGVIGVTGGEGDFVAKQITDVPAPQIAKDIAEKQAAPYDCCDLRRSSPHAGDW